MRKINEIILHHSAFDASDDTYLDYKKIKSYHLSIGYNNIGYHYVIGKDGLILGGRDYHQVGAHCKGHNRYSIGICLVGDFTFTRPDPSQLVSLITLIQGLRIVFGSIPVYPHNAFRNTLCPGTFLTDFCKKLNSIEYVSPVHQY